MIPLPDELDIAFKFPAAAVGAFGDGRSDVMETLLALISTVLFVALDFFDCILIESSEFAALVGSSHLMLWLLKMTD